MSSPINLHAPGAPLAVAPAPHEQVISTFGNYEAHDGGIIRLVGDCLVFAIRMGESEAEVGVGITELLEAIGQYNKQVGS